jgi:glycosyltransferase involved in cell wall biosynthesis
MRSLHVIGSKQPGGAEGFFARLVTALNEAGHSAGAVVPPASAVSAALGSAAEKFEVKMRGPWDLLARWQLRDTLTAAAPDIVLTWLGRATRLVRLPPHRSPLHIARLGGYYNLRQYHHAHAWIGNTRGICDYMTANGLPSGQVFHIPNFVDPARPVSAEEAGVLRAQLQLSADACVILALGRLHPVKGFDILLQALSGLPRAIDARPLHLIILGDGSVHDALHALARQLEISERVHWPGWQTALAPYFALADVFVCPSRAEAFGNVLLEAWTHGVPLVATRTAGASELARDGEDGVLIPMEDVPALTSALRVLLAAPASERRRLVDAGRATLAARYSKQAVVTAYLELFRTLLATL